MEVFDNYAEDYEKLHEQSIKASGFKPDFFDEHKIKTLAGDLGKIKTGEKINLLNFGCGIGKSEKYINQYFSNVNIVSVDVSQESLEKAKKRNANLSNIEFVHFNKVEELNFEEKFDVIFVANVFHHIPADLHITTLKFLRLQLKPEGFLYIFEHNPKNFLTRKAFETCEFDKGCTMIPDKEMIGMLKESGFNNIKRNFVLFFPKIVAFLTPLEKYLHFLPLGAQYYTKAGA